MKQVNDAIAGRWITNKYIEPLPDWEKTLFSEMLVCYQAGKGNRLVPVLIPNDCVKGLKLLSDPEVRKQADILETNDSMFPNTSFSPDHVIGWHCINKMCREAEVQDPGKLTASKQRHSISTIYSSLEVPERERELFYKHMGHSKEVNEGTYQYPLPLLEITKVGRHLQDIDRGMTRVGRIQVSATSTNTDDVQVGVEIEDETDEETITAGRIQSVQQGVRDASEASTLVTRSKRSTRGKEINAVGRIQTGQQVEDASEASTLVTRPNSSTPGKEISTAVHIQLGEDASENSTLVAKPKGPTTEKGKSYFRWTNMETAAIRRDFEEWLNIRDGNTLPGSRELQEYVKRNGCRFDHKTLRTKIMNEQNARKKLVKGRMSEMLDKN